MNWVYGELVLTSLAAMLSPTTLTFSILVLVLGNRPLRAGLFFYIGALSATLAVGVLAAFVLGDAAASSDPSTPKTWVAVLDVAFAVGLLVLAVILIRRPADPAQAESAVAKMSKVASSPAVAIIGAGAALANPGAFIPIALKDISELDPSAAQYIVDWVFFSVVSLLPLALALVMLLVARERTVAVLERARGWLTRNAFNVAAGLVLLLGASLLRSGIAGLTG